MRGVTIIPLFDSVAANIFGGFFFQRLGKRERQPVAVSVPGDRHVQWLAGVADALQTPVLEGAGLPTGAADHVEMAVARVECAAHRARQESSRQRNRGALRHAVHNVTEDEHHGATAPGEMQQLTAQQAPVGYGRHAALPVAGNRAERHLDPGRKRGRRDACPPLQHPDLAATRVVHAVRNPAEHRIVAQRTLRRHLRSAIAIITAAFRLDDRGRRRPFALLRRYRDDYSVRADAKPVRVAETGGKRFRAAAIGCHAMNTPRIRVIEISGRVRFKTGHVIVRIRRGLDEVAEILVEVGFTIAVCILQPSDLITAKNIDPVVNHL